MPHRLKQTLPTSREPASLLLVDRAVGDLRRGRLIGISGGEGKAILACAAEAATPELLARLTLLAGRQADLAMTNKRAVVLGLIENGQTNMAGGVMVLSLINGLDARQACGLADPLAVMEEDLSHLLPSPPTLTPALPHSCESAAVGLTKLARLLPAAVTAELANPQADDLADWTRRHQILLVDSGDIFQYEHTTARALKPVSSAHVPLAGAENTRIIAFRPPDGGVEHLAIVIGELDTKAPVLTRLHSECFTGDILDSLRCDCGDQLRGAISEIASNGSGVLLYLAQEGRGIGLVNKLRAYTLQDKGFDTMDANLLLGFDADERLYMPATEMLAHLGIDQVRLLTNNPHKVEALARCGVSVVERVPHTFPSNPHNSHYLATKADKGGHLF